MNIKKIIVLIMSASLLLTGCDVVSDINEIMEDTKEVSTAPNGVIQGQTATNYVKYTKDDKKLCTSLDKMMKSFNIPNEKNAFYFIQTKDGDYYPIAPETANLSSEENLDIDVGVNPAKQIYYDINQDKEIPTLYLDDGCKLIYYSRDSLLDYITWERYYDLSYTIPIYNILSMASGRQYIDMENGNNITILPDSNLYEISKIGSNQILLQSIGGKTIDNNIVSQGLINATGKGLSYPLEVYDGSYFYGYEAIANMHAFRAYELFISTEYTPLQDFFYEIKVPDYLENGYYKIGNLGLLRLVRGKEWSETNTEFNKQILYPPISDDELAENLIDIESITPESKIVQDMANVELETYVAPMPYSEFAPLNKFKTNIKGVLGYKDKDTYDNDEIENEELNKINEQSQLVAELQENKVSTFNLWCPKGKKCMVTIQSPTMEMMGMIDITLGNKNYKLTLDRLNGTYSTTFDGTDEVGVLTIKGLYNSYDIKLVNCSQATEEQLSMMKPDNSNEETSKDTSSDIDIGNKDDQEKILNEVNANSNENGNETKSNVETNNNTNNNNERNSEEEPLDEIVEED